MYGLVLLGVLMVVLLCWNTRFFKAILAVVRFVFVAVLLPVPHIRFNALAVFRCSDNTWCARSDIPAHVIAAVDTVLTFCAFVLSCRGNAGCLVFMHPVPALISVDVTHAPVKVLAIIIARSIRLGFIFTDVGIFCITLLLFSLRDGGFLLRPSAWCFANIIIPIGIVCSLFHCRVGKAHGFAWRFCNSRRNNTVSTANGNIFACVLCVSFAWKSHRFIAVAIAWSVWFLCRDDLWRNYRLYLMVFVHHIIFNCLQNVLVNLHCS